MQVKKKVLLVYFLATQTVRIKYIHELYNAYGIVYTRGVSAVSCIWYHLYKWSISCIMHIDSIAYIRRV